MFDAVAHAVAYRIFSRIDPQQWGDLVPTFQRIEETSHQRRYNRQRRLHAVSVSDYLAEAFRSRLRQMASQW